MKRLPRLFVVVSLLAVMVGVLRPASALELPSWSDDSSGSDTDPATEIGTGTSIDAVEYDASEDGRVLVAAWRTGSLPTNLMASVGYSDGTTTKWTTPVQVNSPYNNLDSAFYPAVNVSGDGKTVFVAWTEQSVPASRLDDINLVTGAVDVDTGTGTPTVTWLSPKVFELSDHQWWPTLDSSYDGSKVVMTYWSLGTGMPLKAYVGDVTVAGAGRSTTWKGPATITTLGSAYNPTSYQSARLALKVNRAGTRAAVAWWYDPTSTGNYNYGTIRAAVGDIGPTLAFPSSLDGSAWSSYSNVSSAQATAGYPRELDMNDAGSKLLLTWSAETGSGDSDQKWVGASVATLSNATTATWESPIRLYEGTRRPGWVRARMSADGARVFSSWGSRAMQYGYESGSSEYAARVGTTSSGATGWETGQTVLSTGGMDSKHAADMSRDGTLAIDAMSVGSWPSGDVDAYATNIWNDSGLKTDWNATAQRLSSSGTPNKVYTPAVFVAKDATVATVLWASDTRVWARTIALPAPTVTSVAPSSGPPAGGTSVTLSGANFRPGATVTIGGVDCTSVVVVSTTEITCTTGAGTAGSVNVVVTNANGQSGTKNAGFTYSSPTTTTSPTTTVAGGSGGGGSGGGGTTTSTVALGPAGGTWTTQKAAENNQWNSIVWGNDLFVAVSSDGTNRVMTSPDGITWTARTVPALNSWTSITFGDGLFVAVSSDGTNRVMTSPDGITWTPRSAPGDSAWQSITYGDGLFVAVANDGTDRVMTSPDGITWTARTAPEPNKWESVTFGDGLFVAVSSDGANRVMTSPDGINWTPRTAPEPNSWMSITHGGGTFTAVATDGTNRVMTSPDGITWTARPAAEQNKWSAVAYGKGTFVAVASSGSKRVMTSSTGSTWVAHSVAGNSWSAVAYGNGKLVAVSIDGTDRVMMSDVSAVPDGSAESEETLLASSGSGAPSLIGTWALLFVLLGAMLHLIKRRLDAA